MFDGGWMHQWGWWMWTGSIVFVSMALVTIVVVVLLPRRDSGSRSSKARTILDERLARGEIDDGEHHRLRNTLRSEP